MLSLLLLLFAGLYYRYCIVASHLSRIQPEVSHHHIYSNLDIVGKTKSIPLINTHHYHYFNQTHFNELQKVHKLKKWFADNEYMSHLDTISECTSDLEASELYYMFLPSFLHIIHDHWLTNSRSNNEMAQILTAMRIYPMSLHEFNWYEINAEITDEMRLLVLASRSLINYFIPSPYANNKNLGIMTHEPAVDSIDAFTYWSNFNWLRPDGAIFPQEQNQNSFCFLTDLWPIYFSYLYEFYFFALDRDHTLHVSSIFHLEDKAKSNLLKLIRKYKFLPWTQKTLKRIRSSLCPCNVHEVYSDFIRIEKELHLGEPLNDERYMFRTYLIFHLFEECNCTLPTSFVGQQSFKWQMVDLAFLNWDGHKQNAYELCVHILADMLNQTDQFLVDFAALGISVRDPFASDLCYRLWQAKKVCVKGEKHSYFKTLIVNGVINRSKYYWFEKNDSLSAIQEISKLARDGRLFAPDVLACVIHSAQLIKEVVTADHDFLLNIVFVLTKLRTDWDFDFAMEQTLGPRIQNLLDYNRPSSSISTEEESVFV